MRPALQDLVDLATDAAIAFEDGRLRHLLVLLASDAGRAATDRPHSEHPTGCGEHSRDLGPAEGVEVEVEAELRLDGPGALHLLLHELLHHEEGHPRVAGWNEPPLPHALASEIMVGAHLARHWFPRGPDYLVTVHPGSELPHALLLPPAELAASWASDDPRWTAYAVDHAELEGWIGSDAEAKERLTSLVTQSLRTAGAARPTRLADLYVAGWFGELSVVGLREALHAALRDEPWAWRRLSRPLFLCDGVRLRRGCRSCGVGGGGSAKRLSDSLAAGWSKAVRSLTVAPARDRRSAQFLEAVRRAVTRGGRAEFESVGPTPDRSVVPNPGRREALFLAGGLVPAFWPSSIPGPCETASQLHIYLDVSGSMDATIPLIYSLTAHLGAVVAQPVHLFSNTVEDVSLAALRRGDVRTTWGTDFDCVFRHALARRYAKILLVTDGYAGLDDRLRTEANRRGLRVFAVYTDEWSRRSELERAVEESWLLPDLPAARQSLKNLPPWAGQPSDDRRAWGWDP